MPATPVPEPFVIDELLLRVPTAEDIEAIAAACQDADVQRFTRVPSPYTRDDAETFVELAGQAPANGRGAHLAVCDHHGDGREGRLLGVVGLAVDGADLCGELGYWLSPAGRGRGVATRAGRAMCALAFDGWGLGRVELVASAANPRSQAVAQRLGFVHEGTARLGGIDGPSGDATAPRVDMLLYGLLPAELR